METLVERKTGLEPWQGYALPTELLPLVNVNASGCFRFPFALQRYDDFLN